MAEALARQIRAAYPGAYDDLDDATLETKWRAKHGETTPKPKAVAPAPEADGPSTTGERFADGLWRNLNPMGLVTAALNPIDTLGGIIDAHAAEFDKARTAFKEGRHSEAVGHLVASGLPVLGPAAAHAGERIGEGDVAGGVGEAVGLLGAMQAPKVFKATREAMPPLRLVDRAKSAATAAANVSPDVVGVAFPRTANVLKIVQKIRARMASGGKGMTAADEAELLKQGESPQVVTQVREALAQPATSPAETAAAAPARPVPAAPPETAAAPAPSAPAPTPGPETPAAPAAAAPPTVRPGETLDVPVAQRSKGQMSGAFLANDVGIAAKRAGIPLTPQQLQQAVQTVRETGRSPMQVVRELQSPAKPRLSASETQAFQQLVKMGKTPKDAFEALAAMRQLGSGLPSNAVVDASVQARNATGRWPK